MRFQRRRSSGLHRSAIAFACLAPVVAAGCGLRTFASRSSVSVEIIRDKDSAGATIELEKRGDDLTRARVIDIVLGTGEAEIISDDNGNIEFPIDFPGGAAITYGGRRADAGGEAPILSPLEVPSERSASACVLNN